MESENVGVLLHKLTKYQTLLANSNENSKMSTYRQKINQYTSKLENLGVDKSTLTQIGGLAGGADANYDKVLKDLITLQSDRIKKRIGELQSGVPASPATTGLQAKVQEVETRFTAAQKAYGETIKTLMGLIRTLLKQLVDLENSLSSMGVPSSVDLTAIITSIDNIHGKLASFTSDTAATQEINKIAFEKYKELLLDDIASTPNKFFDSATDKHTDLLSVEVRQLANLLGLEGNETDFDNQIKGIFATSAAKKAVENLVDGVNTTDGKKFLDKYKETIVQYATRRSITP